LGGNTIIRRRKRKSYARKGWKRKNKAAFGRAKGGSKPAPLKKRAVFKSFRSIKFQPPFGGEKREG